jgi:hydrogenase nickel incorporation protein HypA/HybF
MHESSVVEALLGLVLAKAKEAGAARVLAIDLVVGEATGYVDESLRFYLERYAAGTVAEGAELRTKRIAPLLRCGGCGKEFARERFSFTCPSCGAEGLPTGVGNEFYVDSMEIE